MISAIFLLFCQQVIAVGTPSPVSVPSPNPDYKADHATVAINDSNDILIAYHSTDGVNAPKQVEVAHYKPNTTSGVVTHTSTVVIGAASHDPLLLGGSRKCERPDVIAVGDMFFVTWTRIYNAGEKPSVLECAWIKYDATNGLQVFNGQTSPDLGYPLDSDSAGAGSSFHVKECAGVADAFVVSESGGILRAGVAYSHQTKMSGTILPLPDPTRRFDMRLALSEFNINQNTLSAVAPETIISNIRFDGDTGNSAALILPDAVRGVAEDEFWLTYEAQIESGSTVQGKVRLSYVKKNLVGNSWAPQATYVFGTTTAQVLRRPMLFNHKDTPRNVSIAFSRPLSPTTLDVHFSSWAYHSPGFLSQELGSNQFNNVSNENRPIPLNATGYKRCYFKRSGQILYYDQDTDQDVGVSASSGGDAFRPAVAMYRGATDDYIATTWEEGSPARVWVLVTD